MLLLKKFILYNTPPLQNLVKICYQTGMGKKKNGPAPTFLLIFKNTTFVEYTAISILMRLSQSESRKQKLFLFGFTHLFSFYFLIIQAPLFASAHQPTAELKGNRNTDDL